MSKLEFIAAVAEATDVPAQEAKRMVDAVIETLAQEIVSLSDSEKLSIPGFGSFIVSTRVRRIGRNPQTGEAIEVPETRAVRFRPAAALKAAVSGA